jgi:hypothetical protein
MIDNLLPWQLVLVIQSLMLGCGQTAQANQRQQTLVQYTSNIFDEIFLYILCLNRATLFH